jgi:hypothetical protein
MSRSSRKSELSPSATGPIDLGKNDGVDMGRKTEPSNTSGGLGVTTEITNIGGVSVTGGVSVDISPIDLGINFDASENAVSVAGGAELPGGLLGVSGGVTVDLDTGEVTGGSVGAEGLGIGVNISASKDGGVGIEVTLQIPFTPIELELGFGFPPKKEPTPTPTTTPQTNWEKPIFPIGNSNNYCRLVLVFSIRQRSWYHDDRLYYHFETVGTGDFNPSTRIGNAKIEIVTNYPDPIPQPSSRFVTGVMVGQDLREEREFPEVYTANLHLNNGTLSDVMLYVAGREDKIYNYLNKSSAYYEITDEQTYNTLKRVLNRTFKIIYSDCSVPKNDNSPFPSPFPSPSPSPFPNPPPRKRRKMDNCCQETLKFLRAIYTGLGIAKFPG